MRPRRIDYIEKPFDVDQLEQLVARAIRHVGCSTKARSSPTPTPAARR